MKFGPLSFYRRALCIALPVMAQLLIQNLVSLIDNFMVAGLGDTKMSGVNVAGQVNFIFIVLVLNVFCAGAGIFMSQFKGAGDGEGMRQVFRYKLIVCLAGAAAWTLFCAVNPAPVLGLMVRGNAHAAPIVTQAVLYQRLIAWTWIPMAVSAAVTSSLRETGEVRVPLIISVAATIVNTCGNFILIYGNFGAPRLEVAGAAVATIIARAAEMLAFIAFLAVRRPEFATRPADLLKVRLSLAGTILAKSAQIAVAEMTWVVSETIATAVYNGRGGAEIVSGMAAGFTIANLFFVSFSGIFTATGVIIGTTLGAGRLDEARRQKGWIVRGAAVFGICFALLGFLSALLIPLVYGSLSGGARSVARGIVCVAAAYMVVWCVVNAQFAVSRTGGDTAMGVIVDSTGTLMMFLPAMVLLARFTALGPVAMYAIAKLSDFYKMTVAALWLRKERWLRNLAQENAA